MPSLHVASLQAEIFGNGELVLIFVVLLMLFGADKLPEFARGLGKVMKEFRKAASDVEREFKTAMDEVDRKKAASAMPVVPVTPRQAVAQEALPAPAPAPALPAAPASPPPPPPVAPHDDDSAHIDA